MISTVQALAYRLTPPQRQILAQAGAPRWFDLPVPWQPLPGRQTALAQALCTPDYALLQPVPTYLGAYQLTPLGEQVAGSYFLPFLTTDLVEVVGRLTPIQRALLCHVAQTQPVVLLDPHLQAVASALVAALGLLTVQDGYCLTPLGAEVVAVFLEGVDAD